jgi:hypothetical protein
MKARRAIVAALLWLRGVPWLWNALVATMDDLRLLEGLSRPWWLYRAGGRIPRSTIDVRPAKRITAEDILLCERLIAAFSKATSSAGSVAATEGIWSWIVDNHHRKLIDTLESRDPRALAQLLASMFQEEFMWAIMGDAGVSHHRTRRGSRILSLRALDSLVSLAEAIGVVSVESSGQGQAGAAFDDGLPGLVRKVNEALGLQVDFPDVGMPYGLVVDGSMITPNTPEQLYAALRLDKARCNDLPSRPVEAVDIVEIGGGYGGMCYWFLRINPGIHRYTIVDLPVTNLLQGYFLAQALGAEAVSFFGEPPAQVTILPNTGVREVATPFDILVNKDGFPEMEYDTMVGYLEWGRVNCSGLLFSYNQEARAEYHGEWVQGVVSEAIDRIGGFTRTRRDHSWLRRGYVEEIYVPRAGSALTPARTAGDAQLQGGPVPR